MYYRMSQFCKVHHEKHTARRQDFLHFRCIRLVKYNCLKLAKIVEIDYELDSQNFSKFLYFQFNTFSSSVFFNQTNATKMKEILTSGCMCLMMDFTELRHSIVHFVELVEFYLAPSTDTLGSTRLRILPRKIESGF